MKTKGKQKAKTNNPCSRRWVFTIYPENLGEIYDTYKDELSSTEGSQARTVLVDTVINAFIDSLPHARGIILSLEEGDSKEHEHLQGYIEFSRPIRFSTLQEIIGSGVHLETARGDREENFAYITHAGKHKNKGILHASRIWGTWPNVSGNEKNMYDEAVAMILEGQSILTIARVYKGAILPMFTNLIRLQNEREKSEDLDISYLKKQEAERDYWQRWDNDNRDIPF